MSNQPGNKKRIYYTSGIISLVLLPVLCLWYLGHHTKDEKQRVMEIRWGNEKQPIDPDGNYFLHPDRKFTDVHITNNDEANKLKLEQAQLQIRTLIATKDSVTGLHFIFDDDSKYAALIRAFEICKTEHAPFFVPDNNDLWVCNYVSHPRVLMNCVYPNVQPIDGGSMLLYSPDQRDEEQIQKEQKLEQRHKTIATVKKYAVAGLLYMLLLYFALKRIYRNFNTL